MASPRARMRALRALHRNEPHWTVEIGDAQFDPEIDIGPAEDVHRYGDRDNEVQAWEENPDRESLDIYRRKRR